MSSVRSWRCTWQLLQLASFSNSAQFQTSIPALTQIGREIPRNYIIRPIYLSKLTQSQFSISYWNNPISKRLLPEEFSYRKLHSQREYFKMKIKKRPTISAFKVEHEIMSFQIIRNNAQYFVHILYLICLC